MVVRLRAGHIRGENSPVSRYVVKELNVSKLHLVCESTGELSAKVQRTLTKLEACLNSVWRCALMVILIVSAGLLCTDSTRLL